VRAQRLLQGLLGVLAQRAVDDLAAVLGDARQHLVGRRLADEDEDRGAAGLQLLAELGCALFAASVIWIATFPVSLSV
jgi:hypothetical protein